jgi:hypothetical protein
MRLIGGHDYYDGAGMGVDTGVVFVRDAARRLADLPVITDHPFRVPGPGSYGDARDGAELIPTLVLIGGERVPALEERVTPLWSGASAFHYELADALRAIERARDRHPSRWGSFLRRRSFSDELRAFFGADIRPEETAWLIDNHVTVLTTWRPAGWSRREEAVPAQINHACLKELELYKRLDPATAHMRVSSFVSGVLPFQRETVELSDKDRIRKAGFDLKGSFRKAPGQKKRARQGSS